MPPQQFLFKRKINELLSPHLGALSLQVHLYFHQRLIEPRDTVDRRIHINKHTHAYNHLMIIFLVYYKFWFVYQLQWFGLVLTKYQQHYSTPSPVSTEMGDRASTAVVGWCLLSHQPSLAAVDRSENQQIADIRSSCFCRIERSFFPRVNDARPACRTRQLNWLYTLSSHKRCNRLQRRSLPVTWP